MGQATQFKHLAQSYKIINNTNLCEFFSRDLLYLVLEFSGELIWDELISNLVPLNDEDNSDWKEQQTLFRLCPTSYGQIISFEINAGERFALSLKPIVMSASNNEHQYTRESFKSSSGLRHDALCDIKSFSWATKEELEFAYNAMIEDDEYEYLCIFTHQLRNSSKKTTWDYSDSTNYQTVLTLEEIMPIKHSKTDQVFWYLKMDEYEMELWIKTIHCVVEIVELD